MEISGMVFEGGDAEIFEAVSRGDFSGMEGLREVLRVGNLGPVGGGMEVSGMVFEGGAMRKFSKRSSGVVFQEWKVSGRFSGSEILCLS